MGATPQQPITHKKLFECLRINQKEIKWLSGNHEMLAMETAASNSYVS